MRAANVLVLLVVLWGIAVIVFRTWPTLDLSVSALCFDRQTGYFLLRKSLPQHVFTKVVQTLSVALPFLFGVLAVIGMVWSKAATWLPSRRTLIFLFLSALLAPGIFAPLIKDYFDRPRPVQISEFGGSLQYVPALAATGQCARNCSFVSGDATAGFFPLALALLARRRRVLYVGGALCFGSLVAATRVLIGKHFLSDVVFSGLLSVTTIILLYRWLLESRSNRPQSE